MEFHDYFDDLLLVVASHPGTSREASLGNWDSSERDHAAPQFKRQLT